MNKIQQELLATDLSMLRKKWIFLAVISLGAFPFYIVYQTSLPDVWENLWKLRHFVGIAAFEALAQISIAWYILKNSVPNYVIIGFIIMMMFFQVTYVTTIVLVANG